MTRLNTRPNTTEYSRYFEEPALVASVEDGCMVCAGGCCLLCKYAQDGSCEALGLGSPYCEKLEREAEEKYLADLAEAEAEAIAEWEAQYVPPTPEEIRERRAYDVCLGYVDVDPDFDEEVEIVQKFERARSLYLKGELSEPEYREVEVWAHDSLIFVYECWSIGEPDPIEVAERNFNDSIDLNPLFDNRDRYLAEFLRNAFSGAEERTVIEDDDDSDVIIPF